MNKDNQTTDEPYLFHVDIKISAPSKGAALMQLLSVLKQADFIDYQIESEIKSSVAAPKADSSPPPKKSVAKAPAPSNPNPLEARIRQYIESNKLIRLNVNKGRGVKMNIPCRIINFDPSNQLLTVYHVDEKQVYTVTMNEIDDFID